MSETMIKIESSEIKDEMLSDSEDGNFTIPSQSSSYSFIRCEPRSRQCLICYKLFPSFSDLKRHNRVHTGEKPFHCPYCDKCFAQHYNLKVHCRTHTGERPYGCTYCNKPFRNSSDLKRHIRIHTGEKPYRCSICGHSFNQSSTLKLHATTHGPKRKGKAFLFVDCGTTRDLDKEM